MIKWISGCFSDSDGNPSSTRLMSFLAFAIAGALCILQAFGKETSFENILMLLAYSVSAKTFGSFIESRKPKSEPPNAD